MMAYIMQKTFPALLNGVTRPYPKKKKCKAEQRGAALDSLTYGCDYGRCKKDGLSETPVWSTRLVRSNRDAPIVGFHYFCDQILQVGL